MCIRDSLCRRPKRLSAFFTLGTIFKQIIRRWHCYLKHASITTAAPHWLHESIFITKSYTHVTVCVCCMSWYMFTFFFLVIQLSVVWSDFSVIVWTLNTHKNRLMGMPVCNNSLIITSDVVTEGAWYSLFNNFQECCLAPTYSTCTRWEGLGNTFMLIHSQAS